MPKIFTFVGLWFALFGVLGIATFDWNHHDDLTNSVLFFDLVLHMVGIVMYAIGIVTWTAVIVRDRWINNYNRKDENKT